jgi:hypothetical protein
MPFQCNVHYSVQITKKKEALESNHRELIHLCETEITIQVYCIWYNLLQKLSSYAASITQNYVLRIATIKHHPFPRINYQLLPRIIMLRCVIFVSA